MAHSDNSKLLVILMIASAATFGSICSGQSTTPWIPVAVLDGQGVVKKPEAGTPIEPGECYVSLQLVHTAIYQKSNWWTKLIEKDRNAVIGVTVTGATVNGTFDDTRTSPPYELRVNDSVVDLGWSQAVVESLPANFTRLLIRVHVSKSSKDGLADMLRSVSEISQTVPSIQLSQTTLGTISAAKQLADFLFNKNLLEKKIESTGTISIPLDTLRAGYYAVLAADEYDNYKSYLDAPQPGHDGLVWTGSQLRFDGADIPKVSYFILRIAQGSRTFDATKPLAPLTNSKPWARLYKQALALADTYYAKDTDGFSKVASDLRALLADARTLFDSDPDYVYSEIVEVHGRLHDRVNKLFQARKAQLQAGDIVVLNTPPLDGPQGS
jgi:hypothetical protein